LTAFTTLPRYHVHVLRVSSCGGISPPFSLSLLVHPLVLLETLLTHPTHCSESIVPYITLPVLLGIPLEKLLHSGTDLSLDCPHCLASIEVGF